MICPKCDTWIPDDSRRCPSCKELLRKKEEIKETVDEPVFEVVEKKKKKSNVLTSPKPEAPAVKKVEPIKNPPQNTEPIKDSEPQKVETKSAPTPPPPPPRIDPPQPPKAEPPKNTSYTQNNQSAGINSYSATSGFGNVQKPANNTQNNNWSAQNSNSAYKGNQSYSNVSYRRGINKVIYCILALLLGTVGAHKFYAKKFFAAIVYIILSISGLTAIILILIIYDIYVAVKKTADAYGNIYF